VFYLYVFDTQSCRWRHWVFCLFICHVRPDRSRYHDILWTAWAISMKHNGEYSPAPVDDLVRFWRLKVKIMITAGRQGVSDSHINAETSCLSPSNSFVCSALGNWRCSNRHVNRDVTDVRLTGSFNCKFEMFWHTLFITLDASSRKRNVMVLHPSCLSVPSPYRDSPGGSMWRSFQHSCYTACILLTFCERIIQVFCSKN